MPLLPDDTYSVEVGDMFGVRVGQYKSGTEWCGCSIEAHFLWTVTVYVCGSSCGVTSWIGLPRYYGKQQKYYYCDARNINDLVWIKVSFYVHESASYLEVHYGRVRYFRERVNEKERELPTVSLRACVTYSLVTSCVYVIHASRVVIWRSQNICLCDSLCPTDGHKVFSACTDVQECGGGRVGGVWRALFHPDLSRWGGG